MVESIMAFGLFGWIPIVVYFKHKIHLEKLRAQHHLGDENIVRALQGLRAEVQDLRETTTKFDMGFDASLTRLEERVDQIDARTRRDESAATVSIHRQ